MKTTKEKIEAVKAALAAHGFTWWIGSGASCHCSSDASLTETVVMKSLWTEQDLDVSSWEADTELGTDASPIAFNEDGELTANFFSVNEYAKCGFMECEACYDGGGMCENPVEDWKSVVLDEIPISCEPSHAELVFNILVDAGFTVEQDATMSFFMVAS